MEDALEHEGALATAQWVKVEPLLQVGRQLLEIGLALVNAGSNRGGQLGQSCGINGHGLFAGRIEQRHAVFGKRIGGILGDGLLVEHLGTFLAPDLWQAELGQGQGFAHPQFGGIGGPCGAIHDRQRLVVLAGRP